MLTYLHSGVWISLMLWFLSVLWWSSCVCCQRNLDLLFECVSAFPKMWERLEEKFSHPTWMIWNDSGCKEPNMNVLSKGHMTFTIPYAIPGCSQVPKPTLSEISGLSDLELQCLGSFLREGCKYYGNIGIQDWLKDMICNLQAWHSLTPLDKKWLIKSIHLPPWVDGRMMNEGWGGDVRISAQNPLKRSELINGIDKYSKNTYTPSNCSWYY